MNSKNRLLARAFCFLMIVFCIAALTACDIDSDLLQDLGESLLTSHTTHTGGKATCDRKAVCEVCGEEYGELAEHIPESDDGDCTTAITCLVCGETLTEANVMHTGGKAICGQKASCSVCGKEYGRLAEHIPDADDGDCTTAITCSVCGVVTTEANATHTGGKATCEYKAACEVCGTEYGELAEHIPDADDGDCTTAITCLVCGEVTTEANATHIGGEATCEQKATCEVCGTEYGELAEHSGEEIWIKHLGAHYSVYSCCYEQISASEDHNMVDGICTICGFNPSITVTSAEVTTEDTQVTLTISITDNPGIVGLMLSIQYNTNVFDLIEATNGEALNVLTFTAPNNLDSGCVFLWDSIKVNDEDVKDGVFLRLTFDIVPDSLAGEYSILLKMNAYDNALTPFTLLIQGGKITIKNN